MKRKYRGNVLVLGHGDRAFLAVLRSLGRAGLNVHVGMCPPDDIALRSRYVTRWHEIPEYREGDAAWINAIEAILDETNFQLVIPCEDQAVIPLHHYRARLQDRCPLYTLEDKAYEIAFSKIKSSELATELGINQPRTEVLTPKSSIEPIADFSFPVIVKPPSSFAPADLSAKRGVKRCRNQRELAVTLTALENWGGALVQENFTGSGVGVELLAYQGEVLVAFQHVRVHEPLEGGGSSYRRSAALHPQLLAASKSLMKALDYTGVAMVEFKFNFNTGDWVFIEINGRFWGSLPLAVAAGVDFPLYLYEMLVHHRREFPQHYRIPLYCRNISSDQRWLRSNLRADKRDPLLATRPLAAVAMESLHVLRMRETWDTLVWDDPAPGLADLTSIVRDGGTKIVRTCRRRVQDTSIVKRWYRRRALARAQSAKNILFVCKGNICRSPFAERYARLRLPHSVTVKSCGYYPVNGRPAPALAQQVAQQFGIDLGDHRSSIINEQLVGDADLIFIFDEHNRDMVSRSFPAFSNRVFEVGIFCAQHSCRVEDPYGGKESTFAAVYTQIADAIDHLAESLGDVALAVPTATHKLGQRGA